MKVFRRVPITTLYYHFHDTDNEDEDDRARDREPGEGIPIIAYRVRNISRIINCPKISFSDIGRERYRIHDGLPPAPKKSGTVSHVGFLYAGRIVRDRKAKKLLLCIEGI